jgi:patatin-like phospholipase/acyl hydrolase
MPETESSDRFQILSLDGGGVRGIFTAAVLAQLEEDLGRPVIDHFDLVVGTSTGGVIALGLGAGLTPRQILDFYVAERTLIFPGPRRLRALRQIVRAKYKPSGLEEAVKGVFGDNTLGDSQRPLVIASYNLGENDVYLFKTPHHERLKRDYKIPMWAVAMATTAAPVYFPAFRLPDSHVRLIDGGVWANNPAVVGVTEAVSMFGRSLEQIRLLSLGTTASTMTRPSRLDNAGLAQWCRSTNIVDVLLAGQSTGAFTEAQHLLGPDNAKRLNPKAPDELALLDQCDARDLIAKAAHYSRIFCPTFEETFGSHTAAAFQPFHTLTRESEVHRAHQ